MRERSERNPKGEIGEQSPFYLFKSGKKNCIDNICPQKMRERSERNPKGEVR